MLNLIFIAWFLRLLANIISYTQLWYVKEYRWDRMFIHLGTKQGKMILFPPFRRPPVSPKSVILSTLLILFVVAILALLRINIFFRFILADLSIFPFSFILVFLLKVPTFICHRLKIAQARDKLTGHKRMTVIGITGSFGKTSTKECLATILAGKYKVLKTEASKNSAIGIAEAVLTNLRPDHEVFIAEMGAYRKGEIKEMAGMVKPQIGIVTAINPQHQDLFKTIKTTMQAKYELVTGLTGKKIAIFNADNEPVRQMADWAVKQRFSVWPVGHLARKIAKADDCFEIKDIVGDMSGIAFKLTYKNETLAVRAPVLGEHLATNISLAIAGAVAAGMSFKEAAAVAGDIQPFVKTMQPVPGINGSLFINDTFNNNPDAALAALHFLAKTRGRKFLVFQPMIELGNYAQKSHEQVGEKAGEICDEIILTNSNFLGYFLAGTKKAPRQTKVNVMSAGSASAYLRSRLKKGDTVLFKGKEAENVLRRLI